MAVKKSAVCEECGKSFMRRHSVLKLYKHSFCSQRCYHEFTKHEGTFKGRNNPNYQGGKIVLCENCGAKIWKIPTRVHNVKHHVCSQRCWNILRKQLELYIGNKHPNWRGGRLYSKCCDCGNLIQPANKRCAKCNYKFLSGSNSPAWRGGKIQKTCEICKKYFYIYRKKNAKFCSVKCRSKGQSISLAGQNAPFWGRHHSKKSKKKISENHVYTRGENHPNFGKHPSEETRQKIRENHADVKGEKHPNWRGGISREPYSWDFDEALRELIRKRDRHKCQLCQTPQEECFQRLSVHHIDYNKQNSDSKNLIALCEKCHKKTNINREYWTTFLNSKIQKEIYAHTKK